MKRILDYTLFALIVLLPFGELMRFTFAGSVSVRVIDSILIGISVLTIAFRFSQYRSALRSTRAYLILAAVLVISHLWSQNNSTMSSLLYLLRALLYLQFPAVVETVLDKKTSVPAKKLLFVSSCILVLSALIQYVLYPPLQNIAYLGFDPHYYRAVGLILDPNLIGILFVFIALTLMYGKKTPLTVLMTGLTVLSLFLTQSRISILAFAVGIFLLLVRRKVNTMVVIACVSVLALAFIFVPKQVGEGNKLLRTNSIAAKTEAWELGLTLWKKNPVLGIGFNNSQLYKPTDKRVFGDITVRDNSFFGLDSTVLTILVTAGAAGILAYVYLVRKLAASTHVLSATLAIVYFVHTFSTNSFFTPTVFVFFVVLYRITRQASLS